MTGTITVTVEDARKMRAIRDLCEATEERRRAAHLAKWAGAMAERMGQAIGRAA